MRLWTLHPRHLDVRGLVALWREGLLAQKVLDGGTRGYRHHPQLARFQCLSDPLADIASYLAHVLEESQRRGYAFDSAKIAAVRWPERLDETRDQLLYEWDHLRNKLQRRDPAHYEVCSSIARPRPHPLFRIVPGPIQTWEMLPKSSISQSKRS
jgi:hypothetical protein